MATKPARGPAASTHVSSVFRGAQPGHDRDLTRERLEADIAAFSEAGGHIEVLGVTPLRRKDPVTPAPRATAKTAPTPPPGPPAPRRR